MMGLGRVGTVKLAAVGDNCMDVYDGTNEAYPGGNAVNVAVYTVRLGGKASYTGVVGDDRYGELMRAVLAEKGVDVSHLRTEPGSTAITHVNVVDGDRILGEYEKGVMADFRMTSEDIDFLCAHDMVVTGLWGMVEKDLPVIKARGVPVAFDFADKLEHQVLDAAIPFVDYAFFSRDEGTAAEMEAFLHDMRQRGPRITVVTMGKRGSMCYDGARFYRQGIVACAVVDTMGAGDSYIAGFLHDLLHGAAIPECMEKGAQNSGVTLQYHGAWPFGGRYNL